MADNVTNHTHAQYAHKGHNHDEYYANVDHNHDAKYASESHSHGLSEIEGGDALIKSMWSTNDYSTLAITSSTPGVGAIFNGEGPRLNEKKGVVLVCLKYVQNNNALVDQSVYAVKFEEEPPIGGSLYYTFNLVPPKKFTSDSLSVTHRSDSKCSYNVEAWGDDVFGADKIMMFII